MRKSRSAKLSSKQEVVREIGVRRWKQVSTASEAQIIAYGYGSTVYHFAKKTGSSTIESKWGSYEAIKNTRLSPFKRDYGQPIAYFKYE